MVPSRVQAFFGFKKSGGAGLWAYEASGGLIGF